MIRLLILALIIAGFLWFFLGYMAAKAEIRFQRRQIPTGPVVKVLVLAYFISGAVGYALSWWGMEDEMREVHNLPPRQYRSKPYRKTWTERFFGE